ncbi:MAG TPA: CDP-alcohol phosphatidyltransferase family protein [Propionibacteriaceae bacterium]|nr:CDP-alcohol phosphatidyltransferase family protein [Propionibacteriaceae bacterium]
MPGTAYDTDRVLTVPNVLSLVRLAGVPLFLWLILGPHADGWAVVVLAVSGATDFLDGYLARRRHEVSRVGQMLDPVVDRTYIAATIFGLAIREVIPWWLVGILVLRDVCMALLVPLLRTRGYTSLPVHFLGKVATFCLLYAFPAVLLGADSFSGAVVFKVSGWAFVIWGAALYWWAGLLYARQAVALVRGPRQLP